MVGMSALGDIFCQPPSSSLPPQHTHCLLALIMAFIFTLMTPSCLRDEVLINTQLSNHTIASPLLFVPSMQYTS